MRTRFYPAAFLLGALLSIGAAIAGIFISLGNRIESGRWVAECIEKKSEAVLNRSPKLVILSGSNALFGFSARRLSEKYGVASVNASVHAGLGINYILDYGRRYLAAGRLFILPLEYPLYGKTSSESAYQYQVIGFDPTYFVNMTPAQKLEFTMQLSLADRARNLIAKFRPYPRNDVDGYQSRTLNSWGDETNNQISDRTPSMLAKVKATTAPKYSIDGASWAELETFVKDAKKAGSNVVLAYPNIYVKALDMDMNRGFFLDLESRAARLGIQIVGNPRKYVFDDNFAFDTPYHQISSGQSASTDRLFKDLVASGTIKPAI